MTQAGLTKKSTLLRGVFLLALASAMALFAFFASDLRIETNILHSLPAGNPVMADGHEVILNHPYQNRVLIDLGLEPADPEVLSAAAGRLEAYLEATGLFDAVGFKDAGQIFSALDLYAAQHLPALLTDRDLEKKAAPLLEKGVLEKRVRQNLSRLYTMESTGRARAILADPAGLRDVVLEKTRALMPAKNIEFHKGRLFSRDLGHVLIIADPGRAATGSEAAKEIATAISQARQALSRDVDTRGADLTLTAAGAYRAVIDNETAAKNDARQAVFLSALGIAVLLIMAFPRPVIGLLAFVPAVFGTLAALMFYALWHESITIMALGFGGAIMAITVDHGISYLLFADRPHETTGKHASREVWAVALAAALTSAGAFFLLVFSGFPILAEIGQFAALGILFSFLFVHTGFPLLMPGLKGARRKHRLLLQTAVDHAVLSGKKPKLVLAVLAAGVLAFFARPDFCVDISAINTVSKDTLAAEQKIADTWGNQMFDRVHVMARAENKKKLQQTSDRLAAEIEDQMAENRISEAFLPSMLFPGPKRCRTNLEAWRQFWQDAGQKQVVSRIMDQAAALGINPENFAEVYESQTTDCDSGQMRFDERFFDFLSIYSEKTGDGRILFASLVPGENYDPARFFDTISSGRPEISVLDPNYYAQNLGVLLSDTFVRMFAVVAAGVAVLLVLFFADLTLAAVSLLPLGFAMVCTLGLLHLLGQPLNIPGLMLSVVVFGMGLDYSLYFVRAYQRYGTPAHPHFAHIRMAVFLAAASTFIGFAALATGEHLLMKSLGLILAPAVLFVVAGTFCLLPAILDFLFQPAVLGQGVAAPGSAEHKQRLARIYRHTEVFPRIFAAIKRRVDPMFTELPGFLDKPGTVLDIGCGYGITAGWLLAMDPKIRITGMDPDAERVRFARRITADQGTIWQAAAPDLPAPDHPADTALMIDMLHYLSDHAAAQTLAAAKDRLEPGGRLIMRAAVLREAKDSFLRRVEILRLKIRGIARHDRTEAQIRDLLTSTGFEIRHVQDSGQGREEKWFAARKPQSYGETR
ncbi:putative exporter/precorrin-6B methylase 2 [Desulfosalsimonas propionicica]|uniref:Putative exporter/precorrin-6B methylase 2 n=2 Tax=Desulfosalsimonas propionicica TaxID=332175 RepID=A0A7W0CBD2_9BACT|nr:putative exporter/precorrin-6B methylase 2 [Desulfosalsimonas propionicica]